MGSARIRPSKWQTNAKKISKSIPAGRPAGQSVRLAGRPASDWPAATIILLFNPRPKINQCRSRIYPKSIPEGPNLVLNCFRIGAVKATQQRTQGIQFQHPQGWPKMSPTWPQLGPPNGAKIIKTRSKDQSKFALLLESNLDPKIDPRTIQILSTINLKSMSKANRHKNENASKL